MSLFNVYNWWSTQCSDIEDNYDVASLLCARFGLDSMEKDYVVVGTHGGSLSIYYPTYEVDANGKALNYKATDLLYEEQGGLPILGVYAGRFSGIQHADNSNQLAVLHPYSIVIHNLQAICGITEHGLQLQLQQLQMYNFKRTAFSLCKGHFGKVKGRDFFCIVHLDGSLTFYEQDGIIYECKFPGDRALPTPIVYGERTDSFYRQASAWQLECFTYQDLSQASINKSHYSPLWSICLGEGIIDMSIIQVKSECASLIILGERNLICLTDTGQIEFILKLGYTPKCFHPFVVGYYWESTARLITVIMSDQGKLFIYESANVIWGAHINYEAPVAIQRSNLNGLPGSIVTLGPTGRLCLGYLGSSPYLFQAPSLKTKELNLSETVQKLQQLNQEIKEINEKQDIETTNQQAFEMFELSFIINQEVKMESDNIPIEGMIANLTIKELPVCTGYCSWYSLLDLKELQITFNLPDGIRCSKDTLTYILVQAGTKQTVYIEFYIIDLLHFPTAKIEILASFITSKSIPRVIHKYAYLPLSMFFKMVQPQKSALIKLNFKVNPELGESLKLHQLLPEFLSTADADILSIGLKVLTSWDENEQETITILFDKSSDYIRIQSDYIQIFSLIVERLLVNSTFIIDSLNMHKKLNVKEKINDTSKYIMADAYIPQEAIIHCMDECYKTHENIRKQQKKLDLLWQTFKELQCNLQGKFDNEPKESLVLRIEDIYDKLIKEGDKLMEMRKNVSRQRSDFSCSLAIGNMIISTLKLEEKLIKIIMSVLKVPAEDWTELSWEESIAPGIDILHHYGPLQCNKITTSNTILESYSNDACQSTFDYKRFRHYFIALFENIVSLLGGNNGKNDANKLQFQMDQIEEGSPNEHSIQREEGQEVTNPNKLDVTYEILNVQPKPEQRSTITRLKAVRAYQPRNINLEAVTLNDVSNEEECDEYNENEDAASISKWSIDNCKLNVSHENKLFHDLGIWW